MQNPLVEWGAEIISRPFLAPQWEVTPEGRGKTPAKWETFDHSPVKLTKPLFLATMWAYHRLSDPE